MIITIRDTKGVVQIQLHVRPRAAKPQRHIVYGGGVAKKQIGDTSDGF